MVKALAFILLRERFPIEFCCLKEGEGAHHVGVSERERILNRAIYVAFCCKVDDAINLLILHQLIESIKVADIHLHELIVWLVLDIFEVGEIASISELIEVDDVVLGIFVYKKAHYMRANKACTSSDEYSSF